MVSASFEMTGSESGKVRNRCKSDIAFSAVKSICIIFSKKIKTKT